MKKRFYGIAQIFVLVILTIFLFCHGMNLAALGAEHRDLMTMQTVPLAVLG